MPNFLTSKTAHKMVRKMHKWRVRYAVLCASVRTFFGCDITSNILRRHRLQSDAFEDIRTVDDYVAASAHAEAVCAGFGYNYAGIEFTNRQEQLVTASIFAVTELRARLAAAVLDPDFRTQCFLTLAQMTDIGPVPDTNPADDVVFEVIGGDYITTVCARLCEHMLPWFVGSQTADDPRRVVRSPRWVYDALQQLVAREVSAMPAELSTELLPLCAKLDRCSPVPSFVEMKAASDLWLDAGSDSPYYVFSSALDAAKLLV